jgi:hypothetical protein
MTKTVDVVEACRISRIYEYKQTIVVDNDCVVEAVKYTFGHLSTSCDPVQCLTVYLCDKASCQHVQCNLETLVASVPIVPDDFDLATEVRPSCSH